MLPHTQPLDPNDLTLIISSLNTCDEWAITGQFTIIEENYQDTFLNRLKIAVLNVFRTCFGYEPLVCVTVERKINTGSGLPQVQKESALILKGAFDRAIKIFKETDLADHSTPSDPEDLSEEDSSPHLEQIRLIKENTRQLKACTFMERFHNLPSTQRLKNLPTAIV